LVLILSIKRAYIHTFLSTKTGWQYIGEIFTEGEDDEAKMWIFYFNEKNGGRISGRR